MNKVAALVLCLIYSATTLAQTAVTDTGGTYLAPKATSKGGTVIAPAKPTPTPSPASINPSANTGQQSQDSGAGANNAAGAALIAAGTPMLSNPQTMPMGMALIAMGILALMQGGEDSGAAAQSGNTAATTADTSSTSSGTGSSTTGSDSTTDSGAKAAFSSAAGKKAVAAVEAAGGSLTAASLTMPDGTSVPLSSFSSASGMSAAGFDGAGAMAKVAAIEKSLGIGNAGSVSGMATAEGGGGASVANKFGDLPAFQLPKFKSPFDLSAAQKAQLAAGKTISMGGDPIGVKGDDIFAMIHRAYQHQSAGDGFITNASASEDSTPNVSIRAPASIVRKK